MLSLDIRLVSFLTTPLPLKLSSRCHPPEWPNILHTWNNPVHNKKALFLRLIQLVCADTFSLKVPITSGHKTRTIQASAFFLFNL